MGASGAPWNGYRCARRPFSVASRFWLADIRYDSRRACGSYGTVGSPPWLWGGASATTVPADAGAAEPGMGGGTRRGFACVGSCPVCIGCVATNWV